MTQVIPEFQEKKDRVLSIFKSKGKNKPISETQLMRELGNLFILGELRVILKSLVSDTEIEFKTSASNTRQYYLL